MITYQTREDGALTNPSGQLIETAHRMYKKALAEVAAGTAEIKPYMPPTDDAAREAKIKQAIATLEVAQTPRRIREAQLGKENPPGYLADLDAKVAALRARLPAP